MKLLAVLGIKKKWVDLYVVGESGKVKFQYLGGLTGLEAVGFLGSCWALNFESHDKYFHDWLHVDFIQNGGTE